MKKSSLPKYFPHAVILISGLVIYGVVSSLNIFVLGTIIGLALFAYYRYVDTLPTYSQNAADSIYYFGFSLTIITLATSAIYHFGAKQTIDNLGLVFSQFGIGLIATCAGLLLRLMIVAKLDVQNHIGTVEEEEAARRQLISDLGILRLEVVGFAEQLKMLNQELHLQQKKLHQETVENLNNFSLNLIRNNQEASLKAINDLGQATISLQNLQQNFFSESLATLKQTIIETNNNFRQLSNDTYRQISSLDFAAISDKTNNSISKLGLSVANFVRETEQASINLKNTSEGLDEFSKSINTYQSEMINFSSYIKTTNSHLNDHVNGLQGLIKSSNLSLIQLSQQQEKYVRDYETYHNTSALSIKKTAEAVNLVTEALTEVANQAVRKLNN